ncbi:MAG: hypothetical protein CMI29_08335 [Opitutae bacterium]|nr:hypothetical protein [Opitutae bacterium]
MLRRRQDVIRQQRCREMQSRQSAGHGCEAELAARRAATVDLAQSINEAAKVASMEPGFRSLSAADVEADPATQEELQEEAAMIYRSINNTTVLPSTPLPVSEEDRSALATLRKLENPPKDDAEAARHMRIAETLGNTVSEQRAKASAATLREIDRVFLRGHRYNQSGRGHGHEQAQEEATYPVAATLFRGYKYFATYMLKQNEQAERESVFAACADFLVEENAVRAQAEEAARTNPTADCLNENCVVCLGDKPEGDLSESTSGWTTLKCKHGFCTICIHTWYKEGTLGCRCPLCKAPVEVAIGPPLPSVHERTNEAVYGERYANGEMEAPIYRGLGAYDADAVPMFTTLGDSGDDGEPVFVSLSSSPQYHAPQVPGSRLGLSA